MSSTNAVVRVGLVSKIRHLHEAVQTAIADSSTIQSWIQSGRFRSVEVEPIELPEASQEQQLRTLDYEIILADPANLAPYIAHDKCPQLKWCQSTFAGVDPLVNVFKTGGTPWFVCTKLGGAWKGPYCVFLSLLS